MLTTDTVYTETKPYSSIICTKTHKWTWQKGKNSRKGVNIFYSDAFCFCSSACLRFSLVKPLIPQDDRNPSVSWLSALQCVLIKTVRLFYIKKNIWKQNTRLIVGEDGLLIFSDF